MEIDLNNLLKGKATRIKDKEYFSAKAYVEPFIERMSKLTDDFRIQAKPADQISLTPEGDVNFEDIVYNRVNIEAVLPHEYEYEGHKQVVGFVYALDTRKPVVKQYVGAIRSACLNLCVFNPEALSVQELEPETAINYSFLGHCLSMTDDINANLTRLSEMQFDKQECYTELGTWIDRCITNKFVSLAGSVKLAESTPIEAYKNIWYNKKSDYYTEEDFVSGFNIYQAFTDIICNGKSADLVNRFEKVQLVKNIMGL
jgi:hypothetical protein